MMKRDKIFENTLGENSEFDYNLKFKVAPNYTDDMDNDDKIHYKVLYQEIDDLIKGSEFEELNKITPNGVIKKLNKVQINNVFLYIIKHLGGSYTKVDLFSSISEYFDIFPNKFYNSLSNKFKEELIIELDEKYNILEKKKINKLF